MGKLIQATGSILATNQGVIAKELGMVAKSESQKENVTAYRKEGEPSRATVQKGTANNLDTL
jgi:hypothetical protein